MLVFRVWDLIIRILSGLQKAGYHFEDRMTFENNIEKLIHDSSTAISKEMKAIVASAESEEDIRHECNKLIDDFLKKAGINVKGLHEYGLAGGRIDSKYGGVIIEYKDPKGSERSRQTLIPRVPRLLFNKLNSASQILKKKKKLALERLFGIGCDGNNLIFVRYRSNKFEIEPPQSATPHTVERLLRALVSSGGEGEIFHADHLVGDFGAESNTAENISSNLSNDNADK